MDKVDELIIDVTLRQNGFGRLGGRNIAQEMEAIANAEKQVIVQNERLAKSNKKVAQSGVAMGKAFRTIIGYLGIRELGKYADEWTNIQSVLGLITNSEKERLSIQEKLYNLSQKTRQDMFSTVDLYRRITTSTESLNLSEQKRLAITEAINKALIIGGGTSAGNKASLIQLGQGLASGQLRGQELNSILEQSPRLAQAIAEGMGIRTGQLRSVAQQGKLTPDVVINAISSQLTKLNIEFAKMKPTLGQSIQVLSNSIGRFINNANSVIGVTEKLSKAIILLSNNIKWAIRALIPLLIMKSKLLTTALMNTGVAMRYLTMQSKRSLVSFKAMAKTFLYLEGLLVLFEQVQKFIKGEDNIFVQVAGLFVKLENLILEGLYELPEHIQVGLRGVFSGMYDAISNTIGELFAGLIGYFGDLWRTITGKKPYFLDRSNYPNIYKNPSVSNASTSSSNQTINQHFNLTVNEAKQGKAYVDTAMQTMIKQAEVDLGYTPIKTDLGYTPIR